MIALSGCAHAPLPTPGRSTRTWEVAVAVATGDRTLEALYTLTTERVRHDVWRVSTVRTRGSWDAPGGTESFDSAVPTDADPWPLTLQHLVATVPADVRLEDGRPAELLDPDDWSARARAALYAADLPPGAAETGEPLLDPVGLVHDLERIFPGIPTEGEWSRAEKMAGVPATRLERCTSVVEDDGERTWDCAGTARAEGSARFHEVRTWTRLGADRAGLTWMETGYSGTLVLMAPDGSGVVDRPIALASPRGAPVTIRGVGDGYAFQRLLWLLIGTVIVPTVLLSLFGVAAIRNQGAAVLRELDRNRAERLELGARTLVATVAAVEAQLVARTDRCDDPSCPLAVDGTTAAWVWRAGEGVPVELQSLGISSELARESATVWVGPPDGSAPLAVLAHGPLRFAWRLDPAHLQTDLDRLTDERFPRDVALTLALPSPDATGLDAMIRQLGDPARGELVLQRPLTGWRLELDDAADPTRAALDRAAWLYPASLVILVGLVIVGAVVTLGSASREIRLSRLQTDFVSSVSHELRTPLTAIKLFVDTLQSGRIQDPAKVQECLDLLSHETDRLSRMIERVLGWARMEAGRRIYDFEPVPPADLVAEALTALRSQRLLHDEPDPIDVAVARDLPELNVDRDAIVEALLNLLQNAVKFTPAPRRIALRGERRGDWVGLTVEDNGAGIPKRHRKRVFEKFYQVDATLSAPVQDRGSGLGLSIARAVARAHGGRVELESEVGVGSRFTLLLPVPHPAR